MQSLSASLEKQRRHDCGMCSAFIISITCLLKALREHSSIRARQTKHDWATDRTLQGWLEDRSWSHNI